MVTKKEAIKAFCFRYHNKGNMSRKELEDAIRTIADDDENFENIVFELGCSVLAKSISKESRKGIIRKIGGAYVYSPMFKV